MAKKIYVLDTNILMDSPNAIFGFDDNTILITGTTLQELDKYKKGNGETGYNARETGRILEALTNKKNRIEGNRFRLNDKADIIINPVFEQGKNFLPAGYNNTNPDNRILNDVLACMHSEGAEGMPVVLVTNDSMMRVNAVTLGIEAQPYENVRIKTDEIYTGRTDRDCKEGVWADYYDLLVKNGTADISPEECESLHENEYIMMRRSDDDMGIIASFREGTLTKVNVEKCHPMGISPRNAAQIMAIDALLAPVEKIPLVILEGPAGTAKTFLSTAAGLSMTMRLGKRKTVENGYMKMVVTRNNILADEEHGALPGDLEDKLFPLMAPFYDNLEKLFSLEAKDEDPARIREQVEDLFANGVIETSSMAYIRGRSLSDTFLILDECQNATRGQMLTVLTRAAENGKVVVAGCVDQIDNPHLDKYNNGLSHVIERFKNSRFAAQVTFTDEECVRSPLAAEASRLLAE